MALTACDNLIAVNNIFVNHPDMAVKKIDGGSVVSHNLFWNNGTDNLGSNLDDFAETFAVWLRPRLNWLARYEGWPALAKLEYVDELMSELASMPLAVRSRARVDPISTQRTTLREYYERKRAHYVVSYPAVYDRDLRRLFREEARSARAETAAAFLRRNRRWIRQTVSKATGEYELALDHVLSDMIGRCRELRLLAVGDRRKLRVEFAVTLTVHTMHALYSESRRSWFAL